MGEFDDKLKLHLRLPCRIEEELQIKDLHKNISRVWLPRQKSRRWCIVGFQSFDDLKAAKADLSKRKIDGKKITIKAYKTGTSQNKKRDAVELSEKLSQFKSLNQFQSLLELAKQS